MIPADHTRSAGGSDAAGVRAACRASARCQSQQPSPAATLVVWFALDLIRKSAGQASARLQFARLAFGAAGHLWGLVDEHRTVTVLVPKGSDVVDRDGWVFRRETDGVREGRSPGAPPRTTIEDTVVDLCTEASEGEVLDLVTRAVQTRRTNARRILACVDGRRRVRHHRHLHALLDDVIEGAQSTFGPPPAVFPAVVAGSIFTVAYSARFLWGALVELDGQVHAEERLRDARRDNAALLEGEVTLRYGWADVTERSCRVACEVAALLRRQGWTGEFRHCPRCQLARDADLAGW